MHWISLVMEKNYRDCRNKNWNDKGTGVIIEALKINSTLKILDLACDEERHVFKINKKWYELKQTIILEMKEF